MKPLFFSLFLLAGFHSLSALAFDDPSTKAAYYPEDNNVPLKANDHFKAKAQIGFWSFTMPIVNHQAFGAGMDIQLWYLPRFSVGFSGCFNIGRIHDGLGYTVGQPLLNYSDINIFQEFKVISNNRSGLNLRFYTGSGSLTLRDKSVMETYTEYDENGIGTEKQRPERIASGSFYRLAPAVVGHLYLGRMTEIEAVAGYNFFCNASFGDHHNFNGYFLQLGFKFGPRG